MLLARDQPNIFLLHMFSSFSFSSLLLRPSNFFLQILNYLTRTGSVRVRRLLYGGCAFVKHCVQYHSLSPSHHRYYHQHVHLGRHYHCHQWVGSGQALCAACPRGGTGQDQPGGGLIMECLLYKPGKCWTGTLAGCVMVATAAPDHDAAQLSLPILIKHETQTYFKNKIISCTNHKYLHVQRTLCIILCAHMLVGRVEAQQGADISECSSHLSLLPMTRDTDH